MWTRKQYMNKEVDHNTYYFEIAKECGISYTNSDSLPRIIKAIKDGDEHLNTIPLKWWDTRSIFSRGVINREAKKRGDFWSLSVGVCTHKAAARQAALDAIEKKNNL